MNDAEKADILLRLADLRLSRWRSRRELEWKISLGLWALLAAAAYYVKSSALAMYLGSLIIFAHAYFVIQLGRRNARDIWTSLYYMEKVESLALGEPLSKTFGFSQVPGDRAWYRVIFHDPVLIKILTTTMLVVAMYLLGS